MSLILDGTNGLSDVDGSAATPAIRGTDANTGIFFPAADTIAFSEGGAEVARFDSSGNLGIGTSSPAVPLDVVSNSGASGITQRGRSSDNIGTMRWSSNDGATTYGQIQGRSTDFRVNAIANIPLIFYTNDTERMRIDTSGIAFINGTTNQDSNAKLQVFSASGNGAQGYIGSYTGGSGGGRANQNVGFHVGQTNLRIYADWDGSGNPRNKINVQAVSAGVELTSGSTSWASLSDERKKDIIEPITDALNKVSGLRTVIGKYKNEEDRRRVFLIAQDVQAVLPEAVDESTDEEKTLGLRYTDVIPLLVASIRELNAKVDAQAAEIAELKAKP